MRINIADNKTHEELSKIQQDYPELTFKNDGYEYLSKDIRERHAEQIRRVEEILKDHVIGFIKFNNFCPTRKGDSSPRLRFQYDWCAEEDPPRSYFSGVGYLQLDHLRDGFPPQRNHNVKQK